MATKKVENKKTDNVKAENNVVKKTTTKNIPKVEEKIVIVEKPVEKIVIVEKEVKKKRSAKAMNIKMLVFALIGLGFMFIPFAIDPETGASGFYAFKEFFGAGEGLKLHFAGLLEFMFKTEFSLATYKIIILIAQILYVGFFAVCLVTVIMSIIALATKNDKIVRRINIILNIFENILLMTAFVVAVAYTLLFSFVWAKVTESFAVVLLLGIQQIVPIAVWCMIMFVQKCRYPRAV